jgi:hypothetical protein
MKISPGYTSEVSLCGLLTIQALETGLLLLLSPLPFHGAQMAWAFAGNGAEMRFRHAARRNLVSKVGTTATPSRSGVPGDSTGKSIFREVSRRTAADVCAHIVLVDFPYPDRGAGHLLSLRPL